MMGMLMEVARMTMMITMRVMVVVTRMMGMLMEVTRITTMMTMNEMKGDDDYGNGDDDDDDVGNINSDHQDNGDGEKVNDIHCVCCAESIFN